jgi:hypothetical protein
LGLGEADSQPRWIGIRRHQAALVILGLGITGSWIIEARSPFLELVAGVCILSLALPSIDGLTGAEFVVTTMWFVFRRRWLVIETEFEGSSLGIRARGAVTARGFELRHRGRLDLSGSDLEISERFTEVVKSYAAREDINHLSIHVRTKEAESSTLLTMRGVVKEPDGWFENPKLLRAMVGLDGGVRAGVLERWSYVRTDTEVVRTHRVHDFTGASASRAMLERLQQSPCHPDVSLHADIIPSVKAQRIASRAVHQISSDSAASSAVGFRRNARSKRFLSRLSQREELVASGEALLRVGIFITVRASSLAELRASANVLIRSVEESGLRVERGMGRQLLWYCWQLPGGPGW